MIDNVANRNEIKMNYVFDIMVYIHIYVSVNIIYINLLMSFKRFEKHTRHYQ